jgi:hypothetical protein
MTEQSIRIVIADGPEIGTVHEFDLSRREIRIGRSDTADLFDVPSLNIKSDHRVSRHHARIVRVNDKWLIVDLGSEYGTFVDGRQIQGYGSVELPPCVPVVVGETTLIMVPNDWLYVNVGQVFVFVPYPRTINYALYHSGRPVIGKPIARNYGKEKSTSFCLKLQVSGFSDSCDIQVPPLDPGHAISLGIPTVPFHIQTLRNQVEPVRSHLRLEVAGKPNITIVKDVTILGFWDLSYEQKARRTIAAFVSPRNLVVERILLKAQAKLKNIEGIYTFRDLLRSKIEGSERLILKTLYEYLKDNTDVLFEDPNIVGDSNDLTTYQTIKAPHHIFPRDISSMSGKAKCIDLSLLFAACLENTGLYPLVIIMGKKAGIPTHALIGCWLGPTPNSVPIIHLDRLRIETKSENLILLECLGIVASMNPKNKKLDFSAAVESATKRLSSAAWAYAVDIVSLRPPYGSIVPLDNPLEPEVDGAIEIAKLFASEKKRNCVETTHLFYGLVVKNGKAIKWLLNEAGLDISELRRNIESAVIPHDSPKAPIFTQNFLDCRNIAEEFARQVGSPSVQEQHLLWALLDKACVKGSFRDTCSKLRIDVEKLRRLLSKQYPHPGISCSVKSLSISLTE